MERKKKNILIVLSTLLLTVTLGYMIYILVIDVQEKIKKEHYIERLLELEKSGNLDSDNSEDWDVGQSGLIELLEKKRYTDAERIARKYIKIYPYGAGWHEFLEDALEGQNRYDEAARINIEYSRKCWKIVNIVNTKSFLYTRMKRVKGKLSPDMQKEAEKFMKDIEANARIYKMLEKDRDDKNLKADKSIIEKLKKKGASNEPFFLIYMDYLIQTKQKDKAEKCFSDYQRGGKKDDMSPIYTYIVSSDEIKRLKKELAKMEEDKNEETGN